MKHGIRKFALFLALLLLCGVSAVQAVDTDGDGIDDAVDNCLSYPNPGQEDADHDLIGDACDNCPGYPNTYQEDVDFDRVGNSCDNCWLKPNPGQEDGNVNCPRNPFWPMPYEADPVCGDACEADGDSDGIPDDADNCPEVFNPDQADGDLICPGDQPIRCYPPGCGGIFPCEGCEPHMDICLLAPDGVGNACDNCILNRNADQADTDGDGFGDTCDNCPDTVNPDQADTDGDGAGDACDECSADIYNDVDGDGVCGDVDNCPLVSNPGQEDADARVGHDPELIISDGVGDACDNCPHAYNPGQEDSDVICRSGVCFGSPDGIGDPCDNCPSDPNPDQADSDALAFWKFDGDVTDSANGYDGNLIDVDSPAWITGMVEGALDFDGDDDYMETLVPIDCSPGSSGYTFEAWVYPEGDGSGCGDHGCSTEALMVTRKGTHRGWSIERWGNEWVVYTGKYYIPQGTGLSVENDAWQHIAAVFDPGAGVTCYKNGEEAAMLEIGFIEQTGMVLSIGGDPFYGKFDGAIDEVAVFPGVLPVDVIRAHYQDGLDGHGYSPGDGVGDACDFCPTFWAADPADTDGDGLGDACDPDRDDDGCLNGIDSDPLVPGPDNDSDGLADECDEDDDNDGCLDPDDPSPLTFSPDPDHDGLCSDCDNCPDWPNAGQEDLNGDGIGDGCDCYDVNIGENEDFIDCGGPCQPCYGCDWCDHVQKLNVRGPIDVVFVPEANFTSWWDDNFTDNILAAIREGYFRLDATSIDPIPADYRDMFSFYYYVDGFSMGLDTCGGNLPDDFWRDVPWADVAVTLTNGTWRGCTRNNRFIAQGDLVDLIMHENGHAMFDLVDEYCGCTWYPSDSSELPDLTNVWLSQADCDAEATAESWLNGACTEIKCTPMCGDPPQQRVVQGKWRWDSDVPDPDTMTACGSGCPNTYVFGEACTRRINYVLDNWGDLTDSYTPGSTASGILVDLHIGGDGTITYHGSEVVSGHPDLGMHKGQFRCGISTPDGQVLKAYELFDPRIGFGLDGGPGLVYTPETDFVQILPFAGNVRYFHISEAGTGEEKITVDLGTTISGYCEQGEYQDPACMALDLDNDGIPDIDDGCPLYAENLNGLQDGDGCPDIFVDVKPGSCPNPLNPKSNGVLPVAIPGTDQFDVKLINPGTIRLTREGFEGGVTPIRWSYEDVAAPFTGDLCGCHGTGADGWADLALKFDSRTVAKQLQLDKGPGGVTLTLTARFNDGTPVTGKDCIRILATGKK